MRAYFLRRLLLIPPTLLGVTLLVFCVTRFAPGGPVEQAIMRAQAGEAGAGGSSRGPNRGALSAAQIEQLKAYYGFDQPVPVAYFHWLGKVLRGDLGNSFTYGESVWQVIAGCLPVTLAYGAISLVLVYLISIPLGLFKAVKHRTLLDTVSSVAVFVGYAIPGYALGALLVVFLAARFRWFPMGGFVGEGWDSLG
ncbi:MAG: ABC transporter permease, partial [Verrucomicrobiota bacterium]